MKRFLMYLSFFATLVAIPSFAQNESTMNVHVDQAVAIPGYVLRPGDYIFRLEEQSNGSRVVAVTSADYKTVYGFIPIFPAERNPEDDATEVRTSPPDNTGLARIDSWFFPGEADGYRFIYSKAEIRKVDMIAQQMKLDTNQSGF